MTTVLIVLGLVATLDATMAQRMRTLEQALADALHTRDEGLLGFLLADDFILRSEPDVDRAVWIHNALTRCWGGRFDITNFDVRAHGDTVIATFVLTSYVDPETCRAAVVRSLISDAWIRQEGGWRLTLRHAGPVPAPDAGIAAQYGFAPRSASTWEADSKVSFIGTGGNASTHTLGLASAVLHRGAMGTSDVKVAFVTSGSRGVTQARSVEGQARHGIHLREAVDLFGRVSYTRDRFAGLAGRLLTEGGVDYEASLPASHHLTVEAGAGWTAEQRVNAGTLRFATATAGLGYRWQIAAGTEFRDDVVLVPDLATGRRWRMSNAVSFRTALTRLLALELSHGVEYRHDPVPGFGRVDTKTSVALVLNFRTLQ